MNKLAVISALSNHALLYTNAAGWFLTYPAAAVPNEVAYAVLPDLRVFEKNSFATFYQLKKPMDHSIFALAAALSEPIPSVFTPQPFIPPTTALSWSQREILYGLYRLGHAAVSAGEAIYVGRFWRDGWVDCYQGMSGLMWRLTQPMHEYIMADLQKVPAKGVPMSTDINLTELDL